MSTPAVELAQYIAAAGIGAGPFGGDGAWSVHVSREPLAPDDVVTVYDTGGADAVVVDAGADMRRPSIQVRVRGTDYLEAAELLGAIRDLLVQPEGAALAAGALERAIGTHWYVSIGLVGDIVSLGRDDNDRQRLVANFAIIRQPLEAS